MSTLASDSTEFRYCTSIPRRVRRTAATAKVRLVSRISPSGTIVTMPATAVPAASLKGTLCRRSWMISPAPSGIMTATSTFSRRLIWISSGDRWALWRRASPSSREA